MKKFILFFAVLALSIGVAWGENYPVISIANETNANVPFSINAMSNQHIQMIYPASMFKYTGNTDNNNPYKFEMNFIRSLTFESNDAFEFGTNKMFISESTTGTTTYKVNPNCTITVTVATYSASFPTTGFIDLFEIE